MNTNLFFSGPWSRYDGGDIRGHTLRDYQVSIAHNQFRPPLTANRTKLIDDAKSSNPQYRGLIHGSTQIIKKEGVRGIYRGLFPVVCAIQNQIYSNSQLKPLL